MKQQLFIYHLISGATGKEFVIKRYRYGMVKTRFPNMNAIAASSSQRTCRDLFRHAVVYAFKVNKDPAVKKVLARRVKKETVCHAVIKAYMHAAKTVNQRLVFIKSAVSNSQCIAATQRYNINDNVFALVPDQHTACYYFLQFCETV
jgi:hypothetical protein